MSAHSDLHSRLLHCIAVLNKFRHPIVEFNDAVDTHERICARQFEGKYTFDHPSHSEHETDSLQPHDFCVWPFNMLRLKGYSELLQLTADSPVCAYFPLHDWPWVRTLRRKRNSSVHGRRHTNNRSFVRGTRWPVWLRHYATSRKVAGSIPDEVTGFFQLTLSFQPHYGRGIDSASNRSEYQQSSWG
jgi:hypothetical protein